MKTFKHDVVFYIKALVRRIALPTTSNNISIVLQCSNSCDNNWVQKLKKTCFKIQIYSQINRNKHPECLVFVKYFHQKRKIQSCQKVMTEQIKLKLLELISYLIS